MAAISVSMSAFVTAPPRVSPKPTSPSSVCICMISRVQSSFAPPDQRIGATKGTLTMVTSILEIFITLPTLPESAAGDGDRLSRQAPRLLPAEEERHGRDLLGLDQPPLRIALGVQAQVLLHVVPLATLPDAKAGA